MIPLVKMRGWVCIRAPDIGYTYVHAHMVYMYPWEGGGMLYRVERGTCIPYPQLRGILAHDCYVRDFADGGRLY